MRIRHFMVLAIGFLTLPLWAQTTITYDPIQIKNLMSLAVQFSQHYQLAHEQALIVAQRNGWPIWRENSDGSVMGLQALAPNGRPIYFITQNLNAAKTVGTNLLWPGGSSGLNLTGTGMIIGEWDGGKVRATHQELVNRVTQKDNASTYRNHSTHVAGTLIAAGVVANARGMAYQAKLHAYEWNDDNSEMAAAAANGLLFSNHSYGFVTGWDYNTFGDGRWAWFGDPAVNEKEDYAFGFYSSYAHDWDEIAFNAPYYLIVKSAGNDRNDKGPSPGTSHWVYTGSWVLSNATRNPDGDYDCIGETACAKNILAVGAIGDIPAGYTQPSDVVMSEFSSWGPTDDGRIKPDIVGNGVSLYSCTASSDVSYDSYSGTSMAAPNVCGSLALLQQHFQATHNNKTMRAATLKALILHTADEAGSAAGPDYRYGWGLLNAARAAVVISQDGIEHLIKEEILANAGNFTAEFQADGSKPVIATICWTDPPAKALEPVVDPPDKMLVNDLDLRISGSGTTYLPWILDAAQPASAAKTGDNITDNVEQVLIATPAAGRYTIKVTHKGSLQNGNQPFSLIISHIATTTGQITVTSPNGGETWSCGRQTVTWNSQNTSGNVKIEFTDDGAVNWKTIVASTPDNHTFTWSIQPTIKSSQCKVRITDAGNPALSDLSDSFFTIACEETPCQVAVRIPSEKVAWEADSQHEISWTPAGLSGNVKIEYSVNDGLNWNVVVNSTADDGCFDWRIPNSPSNQSRIRISDSGTPACFDQNDVAFIIGSPAGNSLMISDLAGDNGAQVAAQIKIIANAKPLDAFGFDLIFNPTHLTFVQVEKIDLTSGWIQVNGRETAAGQVTVGGFNTSAIPVNSTGAIVRIVFKVAASCDGCQASHLKLATLLDDVAAMTPIAGTFSCHSACVLGDINMDGSLSPSDALCAFQIFLQNGVPPAECASACAIPAADANCDNDISPADALIIFQHFLTNTPIECPTLSRVNPALNPGTLTPGTITGRAGELIWIPVTVERPAGVSALGLELKYPTDWLSFQGARRAAATENWLALTANEIEPGIIRLGGFNPTALTQTEADVIAEIGFRIRETGKNGQLEVRRLTDDLAMASVKNDLVTDNHSLPAVFSLAQNYPNPFNAGTDIRFQLPECQLVRLTVYNIAGQKIRTLVDAVMAAGEHKAHWDGRDEHGHEMSSGVYLYKIVAGKFEDQKQMILVK